MAYVVTILTAKCFEVRLFLGLVLHDWCYLTEVAGIVSRVSNWLNSARIMQHHQSTTALGSPYLTLESVMIRWVSLWLSGVWKTNSFAPYNCLEFYADFFSCIIHHEFFIKFNPDSCCLHALFSASVTAQCVPSNQMSLVQVPLQPLEHIICIDIPEGVLHCWRRHL